MIFLLTAKPTELRNGDEIFTEATVVFTGTDLAALYAVAGYDVTVPNAVRAVEAGFEGWSYPPTRHADKIEALLTDLRQKLEDAGVRSYNIITS